MAVWTHSCSLELKTSSKSRPGLLKPTFRRSDRLNMNVRMEVEDLSEGLQISNFVFDLCAGDWPSTHQKQHLLRIKLDQNAAFKIPPMKV